MDPNIFKDFSAELFYMKLSDLMVRKLANLAKNFGQKFQHLIFSTVISTYTSRPTVDGSVSWFPIAWKGKVNTTDSSAKDFSL